MTVCSDGIYCPLAWVVPIRSIPVVDWTPQSLLHRPWTLARFTRQVALSRGCPCPSTTRIVKSRRGRRPTDRPTARRPDGPCSDERRSVATCGRHVRPQATSHPSILHPQSIADPPFILVWPQSGYMQGDTPMLHIHPSSLDRRRRLGCCRWRCCCCCCSWWYRKPGVGPLYRPSGTRDLPRPDASIQ